jgi:hypothetical protein
MEKIMVADEESGKVVISSYAINPWIEFVRALARYNAYQDHIVATAREQSSEAIYDNTVVPSDTPDPKPQSGRTGGHK